MQVFKVVVSLYQRVKFTFWTIFRFLLNYRSPLHPLCNCELPYLLSLLDSNCCISRVRLFGSLTPGKRELNLSTFSTLMQNYLKSFVLWSSNQSNSLLFYSMYELVAEGQNYMIFLLLFLISKRSYFHRCSFSQLLRELRKCFICGQPCYRQWFGIVLTDYLQRGLDRLGPSHFFGT